MPLYPVLLLTLSVGLVGSNSLLLSPIAASVADSFTAATAADVTTAAALFGVATAFSALVVAPCADRIGAERMLLGAIVVFALAMLSSAAALTLWLLCAGQALAGLASGAALPAIYALAAGVAPRGRESETLGVVLTGWTLSLVIGVSLSAVLADWLHWRAVYAVLALAACGTACAIVLTQSLDTSGIARSASSPLSALRIPGIGPALITCGAYMSAFYGVYMYLGPHLEDALDQSTASAGFITLAYGLGFGLAAPLDRLFDRHGAERLARGVFLALAAVYVALAAAAGAFAFVVVLCFLWGVINHLGLNVIVSRLNALEPSQRGAIMGLYSAVTYLAVFVATLACRPLYLSFGLASCAVLSAAAVLPAVWFARRRMPDRVISADCN